ncbi:hypothetical protein ACJMK2_043453 [Sinanodonta woodiana]|uniref:PiggyBac transposable element-derived protein domain-containing protein n=1 Tax=Sinanodonta woodiana TaxID=1069815 RepID=A0ABD3VWX8_SINWO
MGGVDRLDQSKRLIKEKKTMRWYHRTEIKLRVCALYNAFVLEGTVVDHSPSGTRSRDLLSFLYGNTKLIGNTHQVRRAFKRIRQLDTDEVRLDKIAHWPVLSVSADRLCNVCNKKHKIYKANHQCVSMTDNPFKCSKTMLMCDKCNVPQCVNARSNCFVDFHTKVCSWQ